MASSILELDDVGSYQFEVEPAGRRTVVTEMGLVMPTFNRELAALTDEAMDLEMKRPEGRMPSARVLPRGQPKMGLRASG